MKNSKTLHLAIEQDGSTSDTFFYGKQKGRFTVERNALCYTEVITGDWKEGTVQLTEK